jgi:ribonuclease HII
MMTDPLRRKSPVDLRVLEGEVQQALVAYRDAGPAEVVQAAGRLSAESIRHEYDLAAKAIESMGNEVRERVDKLEAALTDCDHDMKLIAEAAASIRDKGKSVYVQIEEASVLSKEIRDTIAQARQKVGA